MKKKIFGYLLIGAMSLALTACSGKAENMVDTSLVQKEQTEDKVVLEDLDNSAETLETEEQKEENQKPQNQKPEKEKKTEKEKEIKKEKESETEKETVKETVKEETVTKVVSNTIERPASANTSTKESTKKVTTKKPVTKKPVTKKPAKKKPATKKPTNKKPTTNKPSEKTTLSSIHKAVKKAYGDNYIPSMSFDKVMLEEVYGLKSEWYTDIIGEGPMMSTHVDTFIAVQANKKNVNDVVKALEKYREGLINDSLQYPMNLPKINASQILKVDNNVFFIMLGVIPDNTEESEKALLEAAKKQNQIAVNAIKKEMK